MNIETEIARLLKLAEPLRKLDDEDPAKGPLTGIIDEVNALRAKQAAPVRPPGADIPEPDPEAPHSEFKRGPGRPPKAREAI